MQQSTQAFSINPWSAYKPVHLFAVMRSTATGPLRLTGEGLLPGTRMSLQQELELLQTQGVSTSRSLL